MRYIVGWLLIGSVVLWTGTLALANEEHEHAAPSSAHEEHAHGASGNFKSHAQSPLLKSAQKGLQLPHQACVNGALRQDYTESD